MATVGRGILTTAAQGFFDALRSYDAARCAQHLAADVDWDTPWSGPLHGRASVEAFLKGWLGDPVRRPTLTIRDVGGDGAVVHLDVSVSGRFGQAPQHVRMSLLCLQGLVHQVAVAGAAAH